MKMAKRRAVRSSHTCAMASLKGSLSAAFFTITRSLSSPRITVTNADAFRWVRAAKGPFDAILIDFPDPTVDARTDIWSAALGPFAGALSREDCSALATLDITGGYIRAAMVSAAYLAAADGSGVRREHVLRGVREEWRKAGRLNFPEAIFANWEHTD